MGIERTIDDSRGPRARWLFVGLALLGVALLWSCSSVRYVSQSLSGGAKVLLQREPIDRVLERPDLDPEIRRKLTLVREARAFAETALQLPVGRSYGAYVELDRPYVSWTVVATPPLSVVPQTWCFPIAGCVSYRGYFKEERAQRFANELATEGMDVAVGGVAAYSTLGWFADPVLSTFLSRDDLSLAGLLFHELAHRRVYVPGDTAFNESFASAVELVGERLWIEHTTAKDSTAAVSLLAEAAELRAREATFLDLVLTAQSCLDDVYRSSASERIKQKGKRAEFEHLRRRYQKVREEWVAAAPSAPVYDAWFAQDLNNAHVAGVADYSTWLEAFVRLEAESSTMAEFYEQVEALADMPSRERDGALRALAPPPQARERSCAQGAGE